MLADQTCLDYPILILPRNRHVSTLPYFIIFLSFALLIRFLLYRGRLSRHLFILQTNWLRSNHLLSEFLLKRRFNRFSHREQGRSRRFFHYALNFSSNIIVSPLLYLRWHLIITIFLHLNWLNLSRAFHIFSFHINLCVEIIIFTKRSLFWFLITIFYFIF